MKCEESRHEMDQTMDSGDSRVIQSSEENSIESCLETGDNKTNVQEKGPVEPLRESRNLQTADVQSTTCKAVPVQGQSAQIVSIEQQLIKSKRDLESMVIRYAKSESDNLQHKNKIEELERKLKRAIKDNDSLANRVKILTNDKNHLSDTLSAKVAQLTVLEQKNCSVSSDQRSRMRELEEKVAELERGNEELLKQIETYKSKEADLLDFSERLSMKQILLQTELDKALENLPDHKVQYEQMVVTNGELKDKVDELTQQLVAANSELEIERKRNEKLVDQCNGLELKSQRQIEELENEIKLVRRKFQIATKELLRRIRQYEPDSSGQQVGAAIRQHP